MLVLPIKKIWFDMIHTGEKKEEYREIKPYYSNRLKRELKLRDSITGKLFSPGDLSDLSEENIQNYIRCEDERDEPLFVETLFRNGYSNDSPSFKTVCRVTIGQGNPKWGAEIGKEYYILSPIKEVTINA